MSKVLIAIDGSEHAGLASAYLINRARNSSRDELLVVTVDPVEPSSALAVSSLARLISVRHNPLHAIADSANPWLEDAGIECEFRSEVGDITDVVAELIKEGGFQEVVLVSDAPRPLARLLKRFSWYRRSMTLHRLRATIRLPVSLIAEQSPLWRRHVSRH